MKYDPLTHHRRSLRLAGYDYTQAGAYFVTLVTKDRTRMYSNVRSFWCGARLKVR